MAAFVCAALSIKPTVRHADYLGNWLNVLHEDNRAIFRAASKASKAADFLLAFREDEPASSSGPRGGPMTHCRPISLKLQRRKRRSYATI
jgi:antirestriction protein ArdC